MKENLKERVVRLTTEPMSYDDFTFTLGGVRYYMDKEVGEDRKMLAAAALRELNEERKKNAALEQELTKFKLKAAEYDGFLKGVHVRV